MNGKNALMNTIVLAILLLSVMLPLITFVRAAESITTDKGLYAIKWKTGAVGYVNVSVSLAGLDPEKKYEVSIFKFHGPAGLNYVKEVYGVYEARINFTIPPTMDARPSEIAGTWNATLYRVVGETRSLVKYVNFGVWAINARLINFGRVLQVWGGGFEPGTKVNFTVSNSEDITEKLFGSDMAYCPVSGVTCVVYGTFSNTSSSIVGIAKGMYDVTIVNWDLLDTVLSTVVEPVLTFEITDQLIVNILKPENGSTWYRTETVPVEVEVLYQDLVPVTAGEVNVTFAPPPHTGPVEPGANMSKTISLTYNPVSKTWVGSLKIQNNNVTGVWDVTAEAEDYYGNEGKDEVKINVEPAILVVESVTAPPATVPRASWVSWVIRVKYKGDGSPVDLDLPKCTVYVVNATTEAVVGSAYVTKVGTGLYNVTWWVPADAPLGEYKFLISPNALYDKVTTCNKPNRGPEAKVLSPSFMVGVTALNVVVKTYDSKGGAEKIAFTPGQPVWIGARVTYADSGVTMSAGTVRAYIYNETGALIDEKPMSFDTTTRMWWCSWDSTGYPAGRYKVVVKARDIGYNVGEGSTYFYLSGLSISPVKGTVPPIEYTRCENLTKAMDVWRVNASIFTDPASGKSLGTKITIRGVHMTPNSKVNVTVDWLPYPEIGTGETILLAMNLPTDAEGNFATRIVFPTTIMGTYKITARDAKGLTIGAEFEVIPGMILTPDPVVGSALIKVIATGLPGTSCSIELLVNGTDAMMLLAYQSLTWSRRWQADANGTLQSTPMYPAEATAYTVKPGFVIPFTEPGTYVFDLSMYDGVFYNCTLGDVQEVEEITMVSDSVKVVNAFKEFTLIVDKIDALTSLISSMNEVLVRVDGNVAKLLSDTGAIKTSVSNLATALSGLNAIVTDVKDGVATIKTDVNEIKISVGDLKSLLNSVGGKVDSISGDVATIKFDVGAIKAKVDVLDAISSKVDTVSGKVDTVSGKVDTMSGKVDTATSVAQEASSAVSGLTTAVWIAVVLSLIAAIASIVAIIQVSRKIAG
jgi:outer membrane murein-binding lipoprotein Lpp